ncbi:MAG TPA: chaperone modulator CbpM [Stellaceae bacterium]|nr:chaperone modulator CbpM [Stellaceae bacterium]
MISFEAMCQMVQLEPIELERWIAQHWVLPESEGAHYVFSALDVARVRLIVELHRDLAVGEDAMSVVLRLLDQLYTTRRQMRSLLQALETLPEDHRAAVLRHFGER